MGEISERAAARNARIARFVSAVAVRPGTEQYDAAVSRNARLQGNLERKRKIDESLKRGPALAEASMLDGPGLPITDCLRNFLAEYNNRIFMGEGAHQPTSFNIMRGFLEPDENSLILKLLPEKYFTFDLDFVLDRITDPRSDLGWKELRSLDELTIYIMNSYGGIAPFSISGRDDLAFSGLACVREANEVSILGTFGLSIESPAIESIALDDVNFEPEKEFLKKCVNEIDTSDIGYLGSDLLRPFFALARLDVESGVIQTRYILEERKDVFNVVSDDPDVIIPLIGKENYEQIRDFSIKTISDNSALFDALIQMSSIFTGLDQLEDDLINERSPTGFKLKSTSTSVQKLKKILKPAEVPNYVQVGVLPLSSSGGGSYEVDPSGLKMERSGFWKTLALSEIGSDQHGRPIQGKTWVTSQKSWFETSANNPEVPELPISIRTEEADDIGSIYVMRNSQHPKDTYKIDYTTKSADERAAQLGATSGQPDMFNVVQEWRVKFPRKIEKQIHHRLRNLRINNSREFFSGKYRDIREVVESVISEASAEL